MEDLVDTPELARLTDTHPSYWHKLRVRGEGPPYVKMGSLVRYRPSAVDKWLASLTRNSTSDPGVEDTNNPSVVALPQQQRCKGRPKLSKLERAKAEAERAAAMVAAMEAAAARARRGGGPEAA